MRRQRPQPERFMRSVSVLIASLMRAPEVAAVQYEPASGVMKLRFLVAGPVVADDQQVLTHRLTESLAVLADLQRRSVAVCQVTCVEQEDLLWIEVLRDPASLAVEEVSVIIETLHERFEQGLVVDDVDPYMMEENALANEEMIAEALSDLHRGRGKGPLIAMREDGRVMVYTK